MKRRKMKAKPKNQLHKGLWLEVKDGAELVVHIPIKTMRDGIIDHKAVRPAMPPMPPREKEVFEYLIRSKCNKDIANAMGIGVRTVKFHMTNILLKLGLTSRQEVIRLYGVLNIEDYNNRERKIAYGHPGKTKSSIAVNAGNPISG